MLTYEKMRSVLEASPEGVNLTRFTESFYDTFCEARSAGNWEPVYSTDFYQMDGFSYCIFLELFNASLPLWRLTFYATDAGYPIRIAERTIRGDTEAEARAFGEEMKERFSAKYLDVERA